MSQTFNAGFGKRCKQDKGAAAFIDSFLLGVDETAVNYFAGSEAQNHGGVPEVGSAPKQVSDLIWPVRRIAVPGGALRIPTTAPIASWTHVDEVRMLVVQREPRARRA
jgi:hypothetical protein